MGQYYMICNLDKHECMQPYWFGHGLKLAEFDSAGGDITYSRGGLDRWAGEHAADLAAQIYVTDDILG